MKKDWRIYLNPFHFDTKVLLLAVWLNLFLAFFLLACAGFILLKGAPMFDELGSRMSLSATDIDHESNVSKLRQMLLEDVSSERIQLHSLANALNALAVSAAAFAAFSMYNSYYFRKALNRLKAAEEKTESGATPRLHGDGQKPPLQLN